MTGEPAAVDSLTDETWLAVVGFPGYEVSSFGRIRSYFRRGSKTPQSTPNLLSAAPQTGGYPFVQMRRGSVRKGRTVHSFVMEAFVGSCPVGQLVCHEDGNFWNCRLDNLRYDTQRSNRADLIRDRRLGRGTFSTTQAPLRNLESALENARVVDIEEWRDVPSADGYQVSNHGRVRSFRRPGSSRRHSEARLLATPLQSAGYPHVTLHASGRRVGRTVHSLVMEAFVGICPNGQLICHEDGDFSNCRLDNLRYDTQRSNRADMIRDRRARRGCFAPVVRGA